jgi:protein-arginine kinase activator protein McsA
MAYTLGQAAKACGKSKSTLSKAVKAGKISVSKNDDGSFSIEPVELFRVFPAVSETRQGEQKQVKSTPNEIGGNTEKDMELIELRIKLEAAQERIKIVEKAAQDRIRILEQDKEDWKQQATRLLTLQQSNSGGLFRRLFGK